MLISLDKSLELHPLRYFVLAKRLDSPYLDFHSYGEKDKVGKSAIF